MPRDINGIYTLPLGTIVNAGEDILPSQHNPAFQDVANALSSSLSRDGLGGMRADLNIGGFSIVNADLINGYNISDLGAKVSKSGDLMTGPLSLTPGNVVSINAGNGIGGIQMVGGDAGHSGYINLFDQNNGRVGYIGFAPAGGSISYNNSQGGGHVFAGGAITRDGNTVWDAGNDGSGSGLDADLWRGMSPAGLFALSINQNGFIIYPNGFMIVWGFVTSNPVAGNPSSFTYPHAFTNSMLSIPIVSVGNNASSPVISAWVSSSDNNGLSIRCNVANTGVSYIALGMA